MLAATLTTKVAQPFCPVKSRGNLVISATLNSMIHHKETYNNKRIILSKNYNYSRKPYGVSSTYRILSPQLLLKKFDHVRDCLENLMGLTLAQREVTLRLLRYWAYYGQVYVKEATITSEPGCSKVTYWRTVRLLKSLGLLTVINRFLIRPHAQISNLYRFDRLLLLLARYLAEHGTKFLEKWLIPALSLPGSIFWPDFWRLTNWERPP